MPVKIRHLQTLKCVKIDVLIFRDENLLIHSLISPSVSYTNTRRQRHLPRHIKWMQNFSVQCASFAGLCQWISTGGLKSKNRSQVSSIMEIMYETNHHCACVGRKAYIPYISHVRVWWPMWKHIRVYVCTNVCVCLTWSVIREPPVASTSPRNSRTSLRSGTERRNWDRMAGSREMRGEERLNSERILDQRRSLNTSPARRPADTWTTSIQSSSVRDINICNCNVNTANTAFLL